MCSCLCDERFVPLRIDCEIVQCNSERILGEPWIGAGKLADRRSGPRQYLAGSDGLCVPKVLGCVGKQARDSERISIRKPPEDQFLAALTDSKIFDPPGLQQEQM